MKKGWEIKKLDEVCEIEYGTRVVNKRDGGTTYPVYGGGVQHFLWILITERTVLLLHDLQCQRNAQDMLKENSF